MAKQNLEILEANLKSLQYGDFLIKSPLLPKLVEEFKNVDLSSKNLLIIELMDPFDANLAAASEFKPSAMVDPALEHILEEFRHLGLSASKKIYRENCYSSPDTRMNVAMWKHGYEDHITGDDSDDDYLSEEDDSPYMPKELLPATYSTVKKIDPEIFRMENAHRAAELLRMIARFAMYGGEMREADLIKIRPHLKATLAKIFDWIENCGIFEGEYSPENMFMAKMEHSGLKVFLDWCAKYPSMNLASIKHFKENCKFPWLGSLYGLVDYSEDSIITKYRFPASHIWWDYNRGDGEKYRDYNYENKDLKRSVDHGDEPIPLYPDGIDKFEDKILEEEKPKDS